MLYICIVSLQDYIHIDIDTHWRTEFEVTDFLCWTQSILWDNDIKSTKHTLKEMIMHYSCLELPEGKAVIKSDTLADLA